MSQTKPLRQREKELQALLATPQGRAELEGLASRYGDRSGRVPPERASVITYIIIYERQQGLIDG